MDKELLEQFQLMAEIMGSIQKQVKEDTNELRAGLKKLEIQIENEVTKRIEVLFDGYKLTHEKQFELERDNEQLKARMEEIESRLRRLEEKSA